MGAENLDLYAAVGLLDRVDARVTLVCAIDFVERGVLFLDAQHVDTRRAALLVGARIDLPKHAVDVVIEIELASLDDGQRSIGLDRGADVGLAHGIAVGVRGDRQQQQRKRDERTNGSESRKQVALPTDFGGEGVHGHILYLWYQQRYCPTFASVRHDRLGKRGVNWDKSHARRQQLVIGDVLK